MTVCSRLLCMFLPMLPECLYYCGCTFPSRSRFSYVVLLTIFNIKTPFAYNFQPTSFGFQKVAFCVVKDGISAAERRSFAMRKTV